MFRSVDECIDNSAKGILKYLNFSKDKQTFVVLNKIKRNFFKLFLYNWKIELLMKELFVNITCIWLWFWNDLFDNIRIMLLKIYFTINHIVEGILILYFVLNFRKRNWIFRNINFNCMKYFDWFEFHMLNILMNLQNINYLSNQIWSKYYIDLLKKCVFCIEFS